MIKNQIRTPRGIRQKIRMLSEDEEFAEISGVDDPEYSDVLDEVLPDEVNEDTRIEWDMVVTHGIREDVYERIDGLAGEFVPMHYVLRIYINEWMQENHYNEVN